MKLTREEAIEKHRALWHEIARRTREEKRFVQKREVITEYNLSNDCYLCEYNLRVVERTSDIPPCYFCPLKYQEGRSDCLNGLYHDWINCRYEYNYVKAAELADQIAELPEVNFNGVEGAIKMTNLELVEKLKPVAKELTPHGDYLVDVAFSSYQRELEELRKEQEVEVQIYPGNRGDCIIHKVLDNMYIVEYGKKSMNSEHEMYAPYRDGVLSHEVWPSFDEALLALVAMKTKSESAVPYIARMLCLNDGGENNV